MDAARHRWLRSTSRARVAVALVVVLLGVAGFVIMTPAVGRERTDAVRRCAGVRAPGGVLDRARAFVGGLGNASQREPAPDGSRSAARKGSATTTVGSTVAMGVEQVSRRARRGYERRIGTPIALPTGGRVTGASYLPAASVTGLEVPRGADMARVPALVATLRDPSSIFAGTATQVSSLAGRRGPVVQGARFGCGPGSRGFLVVFVPADWLSVSSDADFTRTAISLDGRPLDGPLAAVPVARQGFEEPTRRWPIDVATEPPTALQATLPWPAVAWPPATALLVYLMGPGMLRRRRAEHQVDDIFDLSPDLVCVASLDGYFQRVNPAFERTLGYGAAELLSRPFLEFVHPDDRDRTAEMIGALSEGRHVSGFENRCVRADGAVRWLQWNARARPEQGLMYAAARDVTENRMLSQEQAALRRVATLVAEGHDAFELFDAVAGEVGRLLSADATRLLRYRQDGTTAVVGSYGAADAELGADSYNPGRLWRRIAERGDGAAAAAAAPIVVAGRPWGSIVAAWKQPEMAGGDTEIRIGQFTELVATAVANAESGAELAASRRRIVAAADEARRRIERDLHDGAQQRLVHAIILLKLAQRAFREEDGQAESLVGEALEHAQRGIDDMRELARGIHPKILSFGGLGPALETLASRSPIPATVVTQTDVRLPEPVEVTAYYVASEALTNAAKHAQASVVDIAVEADSRWLVLKIRDDGVGGADLSRGSGLISLRDRVQALGGVLEVRSETGGGTELIARIPVAAPAPT